MGEDHQRAAGPDLDVDRSYQAEGRRHIMKVEA